MIDYNLVQIENSYLRFKQFADNLHYRIQENEQTVKEDGKDVKKFSYDIRCNSRIIIANFKDKEDVGNICRILNESVEKLLKAEYTKFKASI